MVSHYIRSPTDYVFIDEGSSRLLKRRDEVCLTKAAVFGYPGLGSVGATKRNSLYQEAPVRNLTCHRPCLVQGIYDCPACSAELCRAPTPLVEPAEPISAWMIFGTVTALHNANSWAKPPGTKDKRTLPFLPLIFDERIIMYTSTSVFSPILPPQKCFA